MTKPDQIVDARQRLVAEVAETLADLRDADTPSINYKTSEALRRAITLIRVLASPSEGNKKEDEPRWARAAAATANLRPDAVVDHLTKSLASRPQEQPRTGFTCNLCGAWFMDEATLDRHGVGMHAYPERVHKPQPRKATPEQVRVAMKYVDHFPLSAGYIGKMLDDVLALSVSPAAAEGWQEALEEAADMLLILGGPKNVAKGWASPRALAAYIKIRALQAAAPPSPAQEQK